MSLGGSLFLMASILCLMVLFLLLVPIRFHIDITHKNGWAAAISIQVWRLHKKIQLSGRIGERMQTTVQKSLEKQEAIQHAVHFDWAQTGIFIRKALQIAARRISIEQCSVNCRIGCKRADYTAYGYGLFWTMVSFVPEQWLKNSVLVYVPDFQTERKDILIQGIIRSRAGQLIGILIAWFGLTVQLMLKQNREDEIVYEN